MTISVVIPTLNEAKNIAPLLDALLAQQFPSACTREDSLLEIIVCDGESEDETPEIAREYSRRDARVKLVKGVRGVSRQRNCGAQQARGELLVFLDCDTRPAPDFLCKIARAYRKFPFAVACPCFSAMEKQFSIRAAYWFFSLLFLLGQGWLRTGSGVCIITPREVFLKVGGFDETLHLGEDVAYLRRASRFGLHRQLLINLPTSGRRFAREGVWRLMFFYARIAPQLLLGRYQSLKTTDYQPASREE